MAMITSAHKAATDAMAAASSAGGGVVTVKTEHCASMVRCVALGKGCGRVLVSAGGATITATSISEAFHATHADGNSPACKGMAAWLQCFEGGDEATLQSTTTGAAHASRRSATLSLTSGLVTCMALTALPGGASALGVVGTTNGSIAAFLVSGTGSLQISMICETRLCERFTTAVGGEVVVDVAIAMDPAGRPEFVAAATRTAVLMLDVMDLGSADASSQPSPQDHRRDGSSGDVPQWLLSSLPLVQRDRSAPTHAYFTGSEVVKVLPPQRCHAAFAMDVALVVVLADSTLRFMTRAVSGGSVHLLQAYHEERQAAGSSYLADNTVSHNQQHSVAARRTVAIQESLLAESRAAAHIAYQYSLSPISVHVAQIASSSTALSATSTSAHSYHDLGVTVNDAALVYNPVRGCMDMVLCGGSTTWATPASPSSLPTAHARAWWGVVQGAVFPQNMTCRSLPARERMYGVTGPWQGAPSAQGVHALTGVVSLRSPLTTSSGGGGPSATAVGGGSATTSECFSSVVALSRGPAGGAVGVLSTGTRLFLLPLRGSEEGNAAGGVGGLSAAPATALTQLTTFGGLIEGMAALGDVRDSDIAAEIVCAAGSTLSLVCI